MKKATLNLFKSVVITDKKTKKASKELLRKTLKRGFIFSPKVIANYDCDELINIVEKEIGLTPEKLNQTFHKFWKKVKEAPIEQLVIEQMIHYFTTYGFEELGIYNKESIYIPSEKLEIPEEGGIDITIIQGVTKEELKDKVVDFLSVGIALKEETIKDIIKIGEYLKLNNSEINEINNKEVKIAFYDKLNYFPENPIEFLRYVIYKTTGKTLLIKNKTTIEEIKENVDMDIVDMFLEYKKKYGLNRLAEIFYRFKPLFLAFRAKKKLKIVINEIGRLARKHHKPIKEDYLNTVTAKLKKVGIVNRGELHNELEKVNTFRKIRLAYALKFRTIGAKSILYKVRNGRGYATNFNFDDKNSAKDTLNIVLTSIIKDISKDVKDKKIYIPDNMNYTLPATEKQFTGNFPSGSYVSIPKDMVVGIHWEDVGEHRIDLDLSMINEEGKIGWDSNYRNEEKSILFSGDITAAPEGATELFYIKKQKLDSQLMFVNYYNYDKEVEVPFKIIVAKEEVKDFKSNYVVNPNNVITIAKSTINTKQKILGLLITTTNENRFYFTETNIGKNITASGNEFVENSRKYLFDFYRNTINLKDILEKAGAIFVDKEECDIDLSPEKLEKNTIINLINNKNV